MSVRYKLIIFDLGNVLLKFDHTLSAKRFSRYTSIPIDEIYDVFFKSKLAYEFDKGIIRVYDFYKRLKKRLKLKDLSYKKFVMMWEDIFWENKPIINLAKRLKKKYILYVISNANKLHVNYIFKRFSFFSIFDKIFLSCKLRLMKPHPNIYRIVLKEAKVMPKEAIFIDDRKELLPAAKRLGIKTIHFKNKRQLINQLEKMEVV